MAKKSMIRPISFRPHHFLCALGFEGKGYSDAFTANMSRMVDGILRSPDGDETLLSVTFEADDICAPCPKRRGVGCESQGKIDTLDRDHAAALKLSPEQTLSWAEAKERIVANVRPDDLDRLCSGCSWLDGGMCKSALTRLHRDRATP